MDNNFFQFQETTKALAELSADIIKFTSDFKAIKENLTLTYQEQKNALEQKNNSLNSLQIKSSEVISNLDSIISQLNKVLEKNGSRNNNN